MISQGLPRAKGKPQPAPKPAIPYRFIRIPDELIQRTDISPGGKLLMGVIITLGEGRGRACWLCNASLAERTGLSVIQVRRLLPELEGLGLIERRMDGSRRLGIVVTWAHQIDAGGCIPMEHTQLRVDGEAPHRDDAPERQGREKSERGDFRSAPEEDEEIPREKQAEMFREMIRTGGLRWQ
jgi:Helix-turn-helix domain